MRYINVIGGTWTKQIILLNSIWMIFPPTEILWEKKEFWKTSKVKVWLDMSNVIMKFPRTSGKTLLKLHPSSRKIMSPEMRLIRFWKNTLTKQNMSQPKKMLKSSYYFLEIIIKLLLLFYLDLELKCKKRSALRSTLYEVFQQFWSSCTEFQRRGRRESRL